MYRIADAPSPVKVERNNPPSTGSSAKSSAAASASPTATASSSLTLTGPAGPWPGCALDAVASPMVISARQHRYRGQGRRQILIGKPGVDHPSAEVGVVGGEIEQSVSAERGNDHLVLAGFLAGEGFSD